MDVNYIVLINRALYINIGLISPCSFINFREVKISTITTYHINFSFCYLLCCQVITNKNFGIILGNLYPYQHAVLPFNLSHLPCFVFNKYKSHTYNSFFWLILPWHISLDPFTLTFSIHSECVFLYVKCCFLCTCQVTVLIATVVLV